MAFENLRCPECNNSDGNIIHASIQVDSNTGKVIDFDYRYDGTTDVTCPECNYTGELKYFACRYQYGHLGENHD